VAPVLLPYLNYGGEVALPACAIAILETGRPPGPLADRFGDYPDMVSRLLGAGLATKSYDVQAGELPPSPDDHRACLITGSPAGVYENHAWIAPLEEFLRAARGKAKLVGICFGHQILAQAFGGRVEKSSRGWGVGLQRYDVATPQPWMDDVASFAIPGSHQDQVVVQPPDTMMVAGSAFCPFGLLAWHDGSAISFQGHPEFESDYAKALIDERREALPDPDAAIASLDAPDDRARVAGWIRRFLV